MQYGTTIHTDSPTPRSRSDITYIHERKSTEKHHGNTPRTPSGGHPGTSVIALGETSARGY
nr:MAG TPA: hypothetical protein [Caudoviricetes sp.]